MLLFIPTNPQACLLGLTIAAARRGIVTSGVIFLSLVAFILFGIAELQFLITDAGDGTQV